MNDNFEDKEIRDALMANLSTTEPSEDLTRRLQVMARETRQTKKTWWKPGVALVGTAAAAGAIVVLSMTPSTASAKSYDMLLKAAKQIHSFQFSISANEDGISKPMTVAGGEGRVVVKADDGLVIQINKGALELYSAKENVVTRMTVDGVLDPHMLTDQLRDRMGDTLKAIDLKKMLKDYQTQFGADHIQISSVHNGLYGVDMESPSQPERIHMDVDAAVDLPTKVVIQHQGTAGAWVENMRMEMKYDDKVDPTLLKADFPATAKRVNVDLGNLVGDAMRHFKNLGSEVTKFTHGPNGR